MKRLFNVVALVAIGGLAGQVLAGGECCEKAKAENAWCSHCKQGFIGGQTVTNAAVYKAMAPAPAPTDAKCETCKKAIADNGVCDHCHLMFTHHMMFKSPVAYALMKGDCISAKAKDIKCEACKNAMKDHGWCDSCAKGVVGCMAFTDKAAYQKAVTAQSTLAAANKAAAKCETCAVAMVTDGKCEACKVSYKDGKMTKGG